MIGSRTTAGFESSDGRDCRLSGAFKLSFIYTALLEPISEAAARRLSAQQEFRRVGDQVPAEPAPSAQRLLQGIRTFFGL